MITRVVGSEEVRDGGVGEDDVLGRLQRFGVRVQNESFARQVDVELRGEFRFRPTQVLRLSVHDKKHLVHAVRQVDVELRVRTVERLHLLLDLAIQTGVIHVRRVGGGQVSLHEAHQTFGSILVLLHFALNNVA